jgi:formate dehydrogenase subunit gamma
MNLQSALDGIIHSHQAREGALLPILHDIQREFGEVSEQAVHAVAAALNLGAAEVHGAVSFYHDFRAKAAPLPVLKLCRAEACQARGVEALVGAAEARAKGRIAIESVYCLGLCSVGPAALVGDDVHARLDADRLAAIIDAM